VAESPTDEAIVVRLKARNVNVTARFVRTLRQKHVLAAGGPGGRGKTVDYPDDVDELVAVMSEVAKLTKLWERRILIAWARKANVGDAGLRWAFDRWLTKQHERMHKLATAGSASRLTAIEFGLSPSDVQPVAELLTGRITDPNATAAALAPLIENFRPVLAAVAEEVGSKPDINRFNKPYASFYFTNPHDRGGRPQAMPALSRITESLAAEPVFQAARVAIADPRLRREDLDMLREWARSLSATVENPDLDGTVTLLYLLITLPTSWSQTGMPPYDRPLDEVSGQEG
jgi:hypothetical protein